MSGGLTAKDRIALAEAAEKLYLYAVAEQKLVDCSGHYDPLLVRESLKVPDEFQSIGDWLDNLRSEALKAANKTRLRHAK